MEDKAKVAVDTIKENFHNLVQFIKEKVSIEPGASSLTNDSYYTVSNMPVVNQMTEAAAKDLARREMAAQLVKSLLGLGLSVAFTYFVVNYMVDSMDPTKKEKKKARERVSYH